MEQEEKLAPEAGADYREYYAYYAELMEARRKALRYLVGIIDAPVGDAQERLEACRILINASVMM